MKYIYGPVSSWRLGRSLGIDLISGQKACTFNCIYCQLGQTEVYPASRQEFVPAREVIEELKVVSSIQIDYITISGTGEPTLASNLGEVINGIRGVLNLPIAVLTNSSLMHRAEVREELALADVVVAKLDVPDQKLFEVINRPKNIRFTQVLEGIKRFKEEFTGKLALQMMFVQQNKAGADQLAILAREIAPDEVQIGTPLRPCPVKPLTEEKIKEIKDKFVGLNSISVYEAERPQVSPIDLIDTERRRPGR